jgi:hypothetical protein
LMSLSGMVEIAACHPAKRNVRHAGERRHPGDGQCPSYRWKTVSR